MPRGIAVETGGIPAMEAMADAAFHVLLLCEEDYGEASSPSDFRFKDGVATQISSKTPQVQDVIERIRRKEAELGTPAVAAAEQRAYAAKTGAPVTAGWWTVTWRRSQITKAREERLAAYLRRGRFGEGEEISS